MAHQERYESPFASRRRQAKPGTGFARLAMASCGPPSAGERAGEHRSPARRACRRGRFTIPRHRGSSGAHRGRRRKFAGRNTTIPTRAPRPPKASPVRASVPPRPRVRACGSRFRAFAPSVASAELTDGARSGRLRFRQRRFSATRGHFPDLGSAGHPSNFLRRRPRSAGSRNRRTLPALTAERVPSLSISTGGARAGEVFLRPLSGTLD